MEECCGNCKFREGCIEEDWIDSDYDEDNWCNCYQEEEE